MKEPGWTGGESLRTARGRALRWPAVLVLVVAVGATSGCGPKSSSAGPGDGEKPSESPTQTSADLDLSDAVFWLSFEDVTRDFDGHKLFPDALDGPFDGRVESVYDGKVVVVEPGADGSARAVAFPEKCDGAGCPRALVELADDPALDPGDEDFQYGASVWLAPDQTTEGSNIVQKGRFAASDSLWKMQVDNDLGHPSCVVRSGADLVRVRSGISIADGSWHRVSCTRTGDALTIEVDGKGRTAHGKIGPVASEWPVRIGAPGLGEHDDQFHGRIDDVYLKVGSQG
jgi:hypothetical protein